MQKSTHSPEYNVLRSELRGLRKRAGLTQRDLAARLAVPHSWVAKVEMGERRLDLVEFCRLVAACGANPTDAFRKFVDASGKSQHHKKAKEGRRK